MNRVEYIELVQQHHPHMGETEILKLINRAMEDFATETECLKRLKDITDTVAGQRYYPALGSGYTNETELQDTAINSYTDIIRIINVWIDDVMIPRLVTKDAAMLIDDDEHESADNALSTPTSSSNERYWYPIEDGGTRLGLVEKSTGALTRDNKTTNFQSISETGLQIRLHYISRGAYLVAGSVAANTANFIPEIPVPYHEALAYKAIATGYKDARNQKFDAAQYFDNEYLMMVKKAKKQARSGKITTGFVAPCDY